jgi:phosphopantothenoylcysteine decarboxylase/phosphopantothenate--cysteine ligase
MKVLLTSGATREPIDAVRFVSNISSGATGAALADALAAAGHEVTLLHGEGAVRPCRDGVVCGVFGSTAHLGERLRSTLAGGTYAVVIQAAAVSDYRPDTEHAGKLSSQVEELALRLVPTPKLLPLIKGWSPRPVRVLGFKLTHGADDVTRAAAVARLFASGGVDVVVHNDLLEMNTTGAGRTFRIYGSGEAVALANFAGVPALCDWVAGWVAGG